METATEMADSNAERSLEDVSKMISLAKLREDELSDETQCISFASNINDQDFTLMELDNALLSYVTEGQRLMFRGGKNEYATLCTNDTTYMVKTAETSNLLLLFPDLSDPKQMKNVGVRHIVPREVTGMFHNYLELTQCKPKLRKIRNLLSVSTYRGREFEDTLYSKYTTETLLDEIQASETELMEGLQQIEAVNIDGYWRLLDFDYKWRLLTHILNYIEENSWEYGNIPKQLVTSTLAELEPLTIFEQFFDHVAKPRGIQNDEGHDLYMLNEDKVCQLFAEVLLQQTAKFSLKEFLEAWKFSVPSGMVTDLKQLKGMALLDRNSFPQTISYFPVWKLPEDDCDRFNALFKKRSKWSFEDICPFVEDLATDKLDVNGLLTKYARVSSHLGVQYYTSKRPVT